MAVVAAAFIGVFAFALAKPVTGVRPATMPSATQPLISSPSLPAVIDQNSANGAGASTSGADAFTCDEPQVTDGDTIRCGALRVRLASIDAPEMPGHCRRGRTCVPGDPYASKAHLEALMARGVARCVQTDLDRYGRIVALCGVDGQDLSCAQVRSGHAVIRYGALSCASR
jgi:endonuclease YncB( thermonuclease family)